MGWQQCQLGWTSCKECVKKKKCRPTDGALDSGLENPEGHPLAQLGAQGLEDTPTLAQRTKCLISKGRLGCQGMKAKRDMRLCTFIIPTWWGVARAFLFFLNKRKQFQHFQGAHPPWGRISVTQQEDYCSQSSGDKAARLGEGAPSSGPSRPSSAHPSTHRLSLFSPGLSPLAKAADLHKACVEFLSCELSKQ